MDIWHNIENEPPPKTGEEFLTCNLRQGGIMRLVYFDKIHNCWMNKGEVIYLQETHWIPLPKRPLL